MRSRQWQEPPQGAIETYNRPLRGLFSDEAFGHHGLGPEATIKRRYAANGTSKNDTTLLETALVTASHRRPQ